MITACLFILAAGVVLGQSSPPPLRVNMISLGVEDPARSTKFYSETLGLELIGKPGEVTLVRAGEVTIVLNKPAAQGASIVASKSVEIIFQVGGVGEYYKQLSQRGCNFVQAPHEVTTGMWAATFADPDGHLLTVLGPK